MTTSAMTKTQFDNHLRHHLSQCPKGRPFLCDGHPLAAEVFIVGFNSATVLTRRFVKFWNANAGMDLARFDQVYCSQRTRQKTKTGRSKQPFSPTRARINKIADEVSLGLSSPRNRYWAQSTIKRAVRVRRPYLWLATNVYWFPTPTQSSLPKAQMQNSYFLWLMGACNPRIIIAHGKQAQAAVGDLASGPSLKNVKLITCVHLSRISTVGLNAVLAQLVLPPKKRTRKSG